MELEMSSDRLCLSQRLSQVCLATPPVCRFLEAAATDFKVAGDFMDDKTEIGLDDDSPEPLCSQDFFCTPDFITPVEQQFNVDLDGNKENGKVPPVGLTPLRCKRPRPDGLLQPVVKEIQAEQPNFSSTSLSNGTKVLPQSSLGYVPPNSRAQLTALRRRVMSPPCVRNPFLLIDSATYQSQRPQAHQAPIGAHCQSRFREEFHEIQEIGIGNFSRVFKVLKRIDGCYYAVKRSHHPLRQDSQRKQALTEVQAMAALASHENIVRYYSSWFENDHLLIQMELCENTLKNQNVVQTKEKSLLEAMRQILKALNHIHAHGLAHLDIKPDNIFLCNGIVKLGDFGRAARLDGSTCIEEGDSRYMPLELLNEDYSDLSKADIFALGATFYELARGSPLTPSGTQFHLIRQGKLALLPGFSLPFQNLLKVLMHPNPKSRPSAEEVLKHAIFSPRKEALQ